MKINSYLGFALLVLLVSYALADEKSQQETVTKAKGAADVDKVDAYGGGGGNWGGGGGGGNWGGGGGGGNWGGGGGGGCRLGCCGRRGYGGCQRCCATLEEAKAFTEQAKGAEKENVDKVDAYGGGGGNWGGGGGGNWGGGGGGHGGGGGNWGGGGCRHGCCYGGRGGYCQRCCASPEEAKAVAEQAKGDANVDKEAYGGGGGNWGGGGGGGNWGGGGGGGCRLGCCGHRGYGGCSRCCATLEEAKAFAEKKVNP